MSARRWLPPLVWAAFILVLTSLPGSSLPRVGVTDLDKVVHFTLYGVLAWLVARALAGRAITARVGAAAVVAICVFAALDEWHQQFIPGRSMELADWAADTAGSVAGVAGVIASRRGERAS